MSPNPSPITMDGMGMKDSEDLCAACRTIDFDDAFDPGKLHHEVRVRRICDVNHALVDSLCRLCSIFRSSVLQNLPSEAVKGRQRLTLFAYRAHDVYGSNDHSRSVVVLLVGPYTGLGQTTSLRSRLGGTAWTSYLARKCILQEQYINRKLHGRVITDGIRLEVLQKWLRCCFEDHEDCHAEAAGSMSALRVIDCETRSIRVIDDPGQQYVALSYVWGTGGSGSFNNEVLPSELPALIEDAILVTKAMGKQFLWIDRYCIHQDDAEEKHTLIQNMGYIYANSHVTIIAAFPFEHDIHRGIPGISRSRPRGARSCHGTSHVWIGDRAIIPAPPSVGNEIDKSSWNMRGWTYQEALLSPRRLVFTKSQAYFQCLEMYCFEGFVTGFEKDYASDTLDLTHIGCTIPPVFPKHGIGKNSGAIVERISECWTRHLTFESDRLKAIAGILRIFLDKFSLRSLCGLPFCPATLAPPCVCRQKSCRHRPWIAPGINSLTLTLDWTVLTESEALYPFRCSQFPSWSWAGWRFNCRRPEFSVAGCAPTKSIAVKGKHGSPGRSPWSWISSQQNRIAENCLGPTARVEVEFDDGARLLWDLERDAILRRENVDNLARRLHIRSWVVPFQFHVHWDESDSTKPRPSYAGRLGMSPEIYRDPDGRLKSILEMACSDGGEALSAARGSNRPVPELLAVVMSAAENGIVALVVTPMRGTTHYQFCGIYRFRLQGSSTFPSFPYWLVNEPPWSPLPQVTGHEVIDDATGLLSEDDAYHAGIIFALRDIVVA